MPPDEQGRPARVATLAAGLTSPQGVGFTRSGGRDVLVIAESNRLVAWLCSEGSVRDPREIVGALPTTGHGSKGIAIDDETVYFSLGSSGNRDPVFFTTSPERAVIVSIGLDGTGYDVVASGVLAALGSPSRPTAPCSLP